MDNTIRHFCDSHQLLEIYTNPDDSDKFGVGYIAACSDNEFLVHSFQENDLDDGYFVMDTDFVYLIRHNTIYLNNMRQFIKPCADKYDLPRGYWSELDLYNVVLNLCQQEHLMAVVRLECGLGLIGWVVNVGNEVIELDEVDIDGMPDGTAYIRLEEVKLVGFGGIEERRRTNLASKKR